ncbi:hypothetical protein N9L68_01850 [bacterium]|nr:hypothetical protein [bacterium]
MTNDQRADETSTTGRPVGRGAVAMTLAEPQPTPTGPYASNDAIPLAEGGAQMEAGAQAQQGQQQQEARGSSARPAGVKLNP